MQEQESFKLTLHAHNIIRRYLICVDLLTERLPLYLAPAAYAVEKKAAVPSHARQCWLLEKTAAESAVKLITHLCTNW